ncbi:DUF5017 domain-containing protein [Flammeovirga kamogawensis]|uniref:DUF5017 domain-containing protein n=1 Tax=Flammeovirga kamogawensis TaxID=373891 RepID=A0ABX8H1J5_9BACT|nr:DUF5017 domain-containing protein [Flammeovirga kamogawensis]MBB6463654.1 hypothetical protein [Flammeovirga kamogawensis]QWG09267.1 DUF5017 domain-containing protein [Flammeovirga kamogawensis]TRX64790.1 hypothetical protein EO216_19840 [Flammeovirga kamogawensis]
MKLSFKYIGTLLSLLLLFSCEEYDFDNISTPHVSVTYSPSNPSIGDVVTFTVEGDADFVTIFTGDSTQEYKYSKVRAEMEYGRDAFEDTVFRRRTSTDDAVYKTFFKDYNTVEEVLEDFKFFGAIEDIELGEFGTPEGSVVESSHPKQLKFRIADRRIPSGFTFKPNIRLFNRLMYLEMRLVPDAEDRFVRFEEGRNNTKVTSAFRLHFYDRIDDQLYTPGINPLSFTDYQFRGFYPNFQSLPNADPSFNPNGFLNDYTFSCSKSNDAMLPPNGKLIGGRREFNDVSNRHMHKIHPLTASGLGNNDYSEYSYKSHPERAIVREVDVLIGGSTYNLWEDPETNYSGYDEETGFPNNPSDYDRTRNFQGDVYVTSIEWGAHTYLPYDEGISVSNEFINKQNTFQYIYTGEGEFTVSVVATNVGTKKYSENGYQDNRDYSAAEYEILRSVSEIKLKVQ